MKPLALFLLISPHNCCCWLQVFEKLRAIAAFCWNSVCSFIMKDMMILFNNHISTSRHDLCWALPKNIPLS